VAQDDRHLTTEQLSTYLDGQVSSEEHAQWDSHLQTCEQCRQGLASLRQTVALLHALPQPALPRSFVLSPAQTMQHAQSAASQAQDEEAAPTSLEAHRAARQANPVTRQHKREARYLRGTLRALSTIAAVAGLLLFLSGLIAGIPQETSMSTASSGSAAQSRVAQPASAPAPQPTKADITPQVDTKSTTTNKEPESTFATNQPAPQLKPVPTATIKRVPPTTPPILPELLFLDVNAPSTRVGLGMLLALLGVMGFIVFKRRKSNHSQNQ
jgi:predicted anti-sigma-YlaC factor YlaD